MQTKSRMNMKGAIVKLESKACHIVYIYNIEIVTLLRKENLVTKQEKVHDF